MPVSPLNDAYIHRCLNGHHDDESRYLACNIHVYFSLRFLLSFTGVTFRPDFQGLFEVGKALRHSGTSSDNHVEMIFHEKYAYITHNVLGVLHLTVIQLHQKECMSII